MARPAGALHRRTLTAMSRTRRPGATRSALDRSIPDRPASERSGRYVIDYALARRAALATYARGRMRRAEICDADPYLLRAARYHGEPTDALCPVCRDASPVTVTYTYGDCFRAGFNGRAHSTRDLAAMALEYPEFTVYVVEVCLGCRWNHLLTSYVLGTGEPLQRRARS